MNDNEAAVRIVADASGVRPGVEQAKGEVGGLAPLLSQLNAQFAELGALIKASMDPGARAAAEMSREMRHLNDETHAEGLALKEMALRVHEGVESFNGMKFAMKEVAEVWIAAFAVERVVEWAKEFAEAREHVEHLAQTFGMTTGQVQQLGAVATATGISLDTITRGMQIMDKNAVLAAEGNSAVANAFKAVGVSANDGRTQMERLEAVADKFKDMDDGPKKVALAMELFGRSGAQLIPILNLGAEGLKEMAEKAKEFDVANTAVSDSAQAKGEALAESINESKLAFQGVANVLGDAFGPVLTEITDSMNALIKAFIDSYNAGGTVAAILKIVADVVEVTGDVLNALGAIFAVLWDAAIEAISGIVHLFVDAFAPSVAQSSMTAQQYFNSFRDTIVIAKDVIVAVLAGLITGIEEVMQYLKTFAAVARDALSLNWGAIQGDWQAGMNKVAGIVEAGAKRIDAAMADAKAAVAAFVVGDAPPGGAEGGIKGGKGGAGGDFNPTLGKSAKEHHQKQKDDLVQQLDEELKAKEVAWAMQQDAQGTAQAYSLQSIADYWQAALQRDDLSQKDRLAIKEKYLAAHGQIIKQRWAAEEDGYKASLDTAQKNETAKLDLVREHTAEVGRMFRLESAEYAKAKEEEVKQERRAADEIATIEQAHAQARAARATADLAEIEKLNQFRVAMGLETAAQLLAEEQKLADQKYAIETAELQREFNLAKQRGDDKARGAIYDRMLAAKRTYEAQKIAIERQATLERTAIERTALNSTASLWGQNISKLLTLQQGFATTLSGLYQGMVGIVSNALASIIEKWLAQHLAALLIGGAASKAAGAAEISTAAAIAGANGVASFAAAPWPIDMGAPAFGASMAAAAGAFSTALAVPSGAGGIWQVDGGLTMLHEEEMVLPSWAATPLRSMLAGGAANSNAPMAANDGGGHGDIHLHVHTMDVAGVKRFMHDNRAHVAGAVRAHARDLGQRV